MMGIRSGAEPRDRRHEGRERRVEQGEGYDERRKQKCARSIFGSVGVGAVGGSRVIIYFS